MQLGVGERGAGLGRGDEPGREVHGRAVEVALAHDHLADREPDAQLREALAVQASISSSASAHATPGALVTNITASPMRLATLAPAAAITSPVVASKRGQHRRELRRVELVRQSGVAGDVGEPDRELHDVRVDVGAPTSL